MTDVIVTEENVKKIKDAYESNKVEIQEMNQYENDKRIIDDSFEMGYNNALEFVMDLLSIQYQESKAFEEDGDAWHLEEIDAIDQLLDGEADNQYEACNYDYYGFGE